MHIKINDLEIDLSLNKATFTFDTPAERVALINALQAGSIDEKEFSYGNQVDGHTVTEISGPVAAGIPIADVPPPGPDISATVYANAGSDDSNANKEQA